MASHPPQCVCTVCTCGRHHCPPPLPPERHYSRDELTSEYRRDFHEVPLPERHHRPAAAAPASVPFSGSTQYQDQYVPMPLEARSPPQRAPVPRSLPFEGQSTTRADFDKKPLEPRQMRAAEQYRPSGAKFDGVSMNTIEYRPPSPEAYVRPPSPTKTYAGKGLPFEGQSTAHADFDKKPLEQRHQRTPQQYVPSNAPFDGSTTNRLNYRPPSPEDYSRPSPVQRAPAPDRHYDPSDLQSEYARDFDRKPLPQRQTPRVQAVASPSARFDGRSTNQETFQAPPTDAYARPQSAAREPVTSRPFEGTTQYQSEFVPRPLSPRPQSRQNPAPGPHVPFQGVSSNQLDYAAPPRDAYAHTPTKGPVLPPKSIPFSGESTAHADFSRKQLPEPTHRPVQQYTPSGAPFQGESTQHHDFPGHQIDVCPAQLLPRRPPSPEKHIYYDDRTVERARERAAELSPPRHR